MSSLLEKLIAAPEYSGDPDLPVLFHKRPAFFAALGFLLGMIVFSLCGIRYGYYALAVTVLLLISAVFFKKRFLIFILIFAVISLANACLQCPTSIEIKKGTVEGTITEIPEENDSYSSFLLKNVTVNGVKIQGKLQVTVYGLYGFSYGQNIRGVASFKTNTNRERYLLSQRVAAEATCTANSIKVLSKNTDLYGRLLLLRTQIAERIGSLFPENSSLAKGMLLGSSVSGSDADDAGIETFQSLGISHLLAVSGLHVGILAGALILLLKPIKPFLPKYLILSVFLLFYSAVTAFSPSVLRASVMMLIAYPAVPLCRKLDGLSSLSAVFVLLLAVNPFQFYSVGFRLSFLAVYGLVTLSPVLKMGFRILRRWVRDSLASSLAVLLSTLPAIAETFGSVSVIALAANLFIIPLVPYFMVPALIVTALSYLSYPVAHLLAVIPRVVLKVMAWIVSFGGSVDVCITAPNGIAYILWLAGLLAVSPVFVTKNILYKIIPAAILLATGTVLWILL